MPPGPARCGQDPGHQDQDEEGREGEEGREDVQTHLGVVHAIVSRRNSHVHLLLTTHLDFYLLNSRILLFKTSFKGFSWALQKAPLIFKFALLYSGFSPLPCVCSCDLFAYNFLSDVYRDKSVFPLLLLFLQVCVVCFFFERQIVTYALNKGDK